MNKYVDEFPEKNEKFVHYEVPVQGDQLRQNRRNNQLHHDLPIDEREDCFSCSVTIGRKPRDGRFVSGYIICMKAATRKDFSTA